MPSQVTISLKYYCKLMNLNLMYFKPLYFFFNLTDTQIASFQPLIRNLFSLTAESFQYNTSTFPAADLVPISEKWYLEARLSTVQGYLLQLGLPLFLGLFSGRGQSQEINPSLSVYLQREEVCMCSVCVCMVYA